MKLFKIVLIFFLVSCSQITKLEKAELDRLEKEVMEYADHPSVDPDYERKVLPKYAYKIMEHFQLDPVLMENWSFAESTHCKGSEVKGYYGRYSIGRKWLIDYCRWNGYDIKNIKDIKKFLKNDLNNCWIAYYSCWQYLKWGYGYRMFFQCWLFGRHNVLKNKRWSFSYERKIFNGLDIKNYQ